jgi:uncharacterized protein YjiS (DUF1127 family)
MSTFFSNTSKVLVDVGHGFSMWIHRASSRNELRDLSDRELRDIGLCRIEARWEGAKAFWMA